MTTLTDFSLLGLSFAVGACGKKTLTSPVHGLATHAGKVSALKYISLFHRNTDRRSKLAAI
jgi:hypothetical protein